MKPPVFNYHRPESLAEAADLLARLGPDARPLAGGQSLVPAMNMRLLRPSALVDIGRLSELDYVRDCGDAIEIGAVTRYRTLERSALIAERLPLLARAMPHIAHPAIRNRGTIGGSLAHNDPAAELPAVLAALDGEVVLTRSGSTRRLRWNDFFLGALTTAAEPDEILSAVILPAPRTARCAVLEIARRHGDFALAGVAVALIPQGEAIGEARIALFGVGEGPQRAATAERLLQGASPDADLLRRAGEAAAAELDPPSDLHASSQYRREAVAALLPRAVRAAWHGDTA